MAEPLDLVLVLLIRHAEGELSVQPPTPSALSSSSSAFSALSSSKLEGGSNGGRASAGGGGVPRRWHPPWPFLTYCVSDGLARTVVEYAVRAAPRKGSAATAPVGWRLRGWCPAATPSSPPSSPFLPAGAAIAPSSSSAPPKAALEEAENDEDGGDLILSEAGDHKAERGLGGGAGGNVTAAVQGAWVLLHEAFDIEVDEPSQGFRFRIAEPRACTHHRIEFVPRQRSGGRADSIDGEEGGRWALEIGLVSFYEEAESTDRREQGDEVKEEKGGGEVDRAQLDCRLDRLLARKAAEGVRVHVLLYREVSMVLSNGSALAKRRLLEASERAISSQSRQGQGGRGGLAFTTTTTHNSSSSFGNTRTSTATSLASTGTVVEHGQALRLTDTDEREEACPGSDRRRKGGRTEPRMIEVLRHAAPAQGTLRDGGGHFYSFGKEVGDTWWSHHEKICVVDQELAFVGGIDLGIGRFDDGRHELLDRSAAVWEGPDYLNQGIRDLRPSDVTAERRASWAPHVDLIDRSQKPRGPWHDVQMAVSGDAARDVARHFIGRWNRALAELKSSGRANKRSFLLPQSAPPAPDDHPPAAESAPSAPQAAGCDRRLRKGVLLPFTSRCQVLRSVCAWSNGSRVERSVEEGMLSAISSAQSFLYIEHQFFCSSLAGAPIRNRVALALAERVGRAMAEGKRFRLVVVLPQLPQAGGGDATSSASVRLVLHWQNSTIRSLMARVAELFELHKPRLAEDAKIHDYACFYCLRGARWDDVMQQPVSEQIYVHSKLIVVDDRVALVGSANINDRSLLGTRDSEVALLVSPHHGDVFLPPTKRATSSSSQRGSATTPANNLGNGDHSRTNSADGGGCSVDGGGGGGGRGGGGGGGDDDDSAVVPSIMDGRPWMASAFSHSLRTALWAEHLGLLPEGLSGANAAWKTEAAAAEEEVSGGSGGTSSFLSGANAAWTEAAAAEEEESGGSGGASSFRAAPPRSPPTSAFRSVAFHGGTNSSTSDNSNRPTPPPGPLARTPSPHAAPAPTSASTLATGLSPNRTRGRRKAVRAGACNTNPLLTAMDKAANDSSQMDEATVAGASQGEGAVPSAAAAAPTKSRASELLDPFGSLWHETAVHNTAILEPVVAAARPPRTLAHWLLTLPALCTYCHCLSQEDIPALPAQRPPQTLRHPTSASASLRHSSSRLRRERAGTEGGTRAAAGPPAAAANRLSL